MTKATWNGQVIAESNKTIVVEGNHYFPPESLKKEFFKPSETTSTCPWKGEASYYDIEVNNNTNEGAAWYYPEPKEEADKLGIKNYVAFWAGVEISE
jgi:uncharacterized protein (DUF427 family)